MDYIRAFLPDSGPNGHIEYSDSITKDDPSSDAVKEVKKGSN